MLNPNLNHSFNIGNSNKVWFQQQQVLKVNYVTAANSLKPSLKLEWSNWKGKNISAKIEAASVMGSQENEGK